MCPTPCQNCENYPTPLGELSSDWIRVPLPYSFIVPFPGLAGAIYHWNKNSQHMCNQLDTAAP